MFVMFFNVVFSMFVCYSAAFCQLCFYNKDWIGLDRHFLTRVPSTMALTIVGLDRWIWHFLAFRWLSKCSLWPHWYR